MDSDTWNRRYAERELIWTAEPNRFLVTEAGSLEPGRALDLACGEGRNAVWLAQRGWSVTGVDFAEVGLRKAATLAQARGVELDLRCCDLLAYEPEPDSFDLVALLYLQVSAAERRQIVSTAARAVAARGTMLVVGHDLANLEDGYGGPKSAEVLYTAQDIVADLSGSGLAIERAERVRRPVDTPEGERVALDALVRASRV